MYSFLTLPNSMSTKKSDQVEKQTWYLCQPELEKLDIFAELELEKIKLISHV